MESLDAPTKGALLSQDVTLALVEKSETEDAPELYCTVLTRGSDRLIDSRVKPFRTVAIGRADTVDDGMRCTRAVHPITMSDDHTHHHKSIIGRRYDSVSTERRRLAAAVAPPPRSTVVCPFCSPKKGRKKGKNIARLVYKRTNEGSKRQQNNTANTVLR